MSSESRIWAIRLFGSMRGGSAVGIGPRAFQPILSRLLCNSEVRRGFGGRAALRRSDGILEPTSALSQWRQTYWGSRENSEEARDHPVVPAPFNVKCTALDGTASSRPGGKVEGNGLALLPEGWLVVVSRLRHCSEVDRDPPRNSKASVRQ